MAILDDGIIESGWNVQTPAGTLRLLQQQLRSQARLREWRVALTIAVLDFVTAVPAFPSSGISNPNLAVDATGNTPDIAGTGLLATIAPFTFAPATFATTFAQYVSRPVSVSGSVMTGVSIHGWLQFPPGDPGLLGCGADTSYSLPASRAAPSTPHPDSRRRRPSSPRGTGESRLNTN